MNNITWYWCPFFLLFMSFGILYRSYCSLCCFLFGPIGHQYASAKYTTMGVPSTPLWEYQVRRYTTAVRLVHVLQHLQVLSSKYFQVQDLHLVRPPRTSYLQVQLRRHVHVNLNLDLEVASMASMALDSTCTCSTYSNNMYMYVHVHIQL